VGIQVSRSVLAMLRRRRRPPLDRPRKVTTLCRALEHGDSRLGATAAIRELIEGILLEPDGEQLRITLKGDLAGMLSASRDSKRPPDTGDLLVESGGVHRRYLQLWLAAP